MQLIVVGMHRSGTSSVTRLLNMAGAYFGPEGAGTEPSDENPKGFWERRDVRRVCDGLLQSSGFDWWKIADLDVEAFEPDAVAPHLEGFAEVLRSMDAHRPWVLKEPRLCLLLPLLRPMLEVPVVVHVTREPLETASSLSTRNGFPMPVSVALWEHYTLQSLRASEGLPRYHVRHEDVLEDPTATFDALLDFLSEQGVHGLRRPSDREITAFVDPALNRHRQPRSERGDLLNGSQLGLAAAVDDDTLFDPEWSNRTPSSGSTETLRAFEDARERIEELTAARVDLLRTATDGVRHAERRLISIEQSRLWQLTERIRLLKQELTPGTAPEEQGLIERVVADLADLREAFDNASIRVRPHDGFGADGVDRVEHLPDGSTIRHAGPVRAGSESRPKVAVLAWDVGHNPLGRAYAMAEMLGRRFEVEVWGAGFDRYGNGLWAPLRQPRLPVHHFRGRELPDHLEAMKWIADRIDADALWISKPRFPSVALGVLAKEIRNRPLVLDIDDHELAFFDLDDGLELQALERFDTDDLRLPFEKAWTQACEPLVGCADALTVSNVALQCRYGGRIVPHARDERRFDPSLYDRDETRARLGVAPNDRLLLFGGTPRVHKGVVEVLQALERLGDRRYKLALFGTRELDELRGDIEGMERWVVGLPHQPFDELAATVGAADLACVLQDPSHPVARYQMPAKVTDAIAMQVPCLVTDVPPLRPLIDAEVVHLQDEATPLHEAIAAIFDDVDRTAERAQRGRQLFLDEYSHEAVSQQIAPLFDQLLGDTPPLDPALIDLVEAPRRLLVRASGRGGEARVAHDAGDALPSRVPGSRRWRAAPGEQYDLVVFWKQNDSAIYGRRQDMFLEYLRRSGRFANIVHFDDPVTPEKLYAVHREAGGATADQTRFVTRQTLDRLLHRSDRDGVVRRTFLHGGRWSRRLGLRSRDAYPDYVASVLRRHGVGERLTVFWVYPTNDDLPRLIDAWSPDLVVADVVDDNRTWHPPDSARRRRIERNYREVLARSDVVLANCEPVAVAMAEHGREVHLVPNGCELPDGPRAQAPPELRELDGPVIGYVGNLSDRIDIELLDDLARARPGWQFVLVGSAHRDQSVLRLDRHENVHFMGVRPYVEAKRFVDHFDVALIAHVDNEMTRSMNPLKAYVYAAAGVPVVSTPIANIDGLGDLITVAKGLDDFVAAIEDALVTGRAEPDLTALAPHAWDRRVEQVLAFIDEAAGVDEFG